jgi:apolipoprotein N-acyltransferase
MAKRGKKVRGEPPAAQRKDKGNLAARLQLVPRLKRWSIAAGLGVLSSIIFAPVEFGWAAWLCLAPILLYGIKDTKPRGLFGLGYFWGLGHYLFCLSWLKEVFLPAPLGVAIICAFYPALWLQFCGWVYWNLLRPPERDLEEQCSDQPSPAPTMSLPKELLAMFLMAAAWIALEWVRSWLFTGFPWNQLGNGAGRCRSV